MQVTEGAGWVDGSYLEAVTPGSVPVQARWYGHEFDGGVMACGGVYSADDPTVVATNGWPCGAVLNICAVGRCVLVTVRDRGRMGPGQLDLSAAAFQHLATLGVGVLSATLQVVDVTASGSSASPAPGPSH